MKPNFESQIFDAPYQKILPLIENVNTLQGNAKLKFQLWIDRNGLLFLQITENSNKGTTFSKLLFPLSADTWTVINDQAANKKLNSYNLETGESQLSQNNNDSGFLKAAFAHLLKS